MIFIFFHHLSPMGPINELQRCPSRVWSQGIYPFLPGSRLRVFVAMQVQHSYTSNGSRIGDITHAHCTCSEYGKGEAHINWSMGLPEKATPQSYSIYNEWDKWPCASGLSMMTPLERNFCVRLTRWRSYGADTTPWRKAGGKRAARE